LEGGRAGAGRMAFICLSHKGDLDGLASAALARLAFRAQVELVGYGELEAQLARLAGEQLIITDLGLYGPRFKRYLDLLPRGRFIYLDHHTLPPAARRALIARGGEVVHSTRDCTSALFFHHYKDKLPREAARLAAMAALSDYMEAGPIARQLLEGLERFTLFLDVALYTLAILAWEKRRRHLLGLVEMLSQLKPATSSREVTEEALALAARLQALRTGLATAVTHYESFSVVEANDENTGLLASLALEVTSRPIAVAVRRTRSEVKLSLRSKRLPLLHLGRLVSSVAEEVGGDGGGHAQAAGARIRSQELTPFLQRLDRRLGGLLRPSRAGKGA